MLGHVTSKFDRDTRLRLQRVMLGLISYLMFVVPLSIAVHAGSSTMGWLGVAFFACLAVSVNVLALLAIASGWSKRFADPSLLVPQLVAALVLALGMIHFFQGEARSVLLLLFVAIFFFGLFGIDTRRYLLLTTCTALGYAALSIWELVDRGATRHDWWMDALRLSALVVITIWMSFIGGYFDSIRKKLAGQRDALEQANSKLRELSIRDELTGLHNRRHLTERLEQESERGRRYGHSFSVAMIDIDHFKKINDCHGLLDQSGPSRTSVVVARGSWVSPIGRSEGTSLA